MATIKIKYHPLPDSPGEGMVCYEVCHAMTSLLIDTDFIIPASEWDNGSSTVRASADAPRSAILTEMRRLISCGERRLVRIVADLDRSGINYDAAHVAAEFRRLLDLYNFPAYMESLISHLKGVGKVRTSEAYASALRSFLSFAASRTPAANAAGSLMLDALTPALFEEYEAWHRRRGSVPNTISFYMRILRAVYNRAVEEGITDDMHPFRHVYTGVDKTVKRAITLSSLRKIIRLDLSGAPSLEYARDMFLMSFYLRGMSFIDMAFLKKSDLCGGYLSYRRRKTGQLMTIRWTREMQQIIDRYPRNATHYLLPIITGGHTDEICCYRSASSTINRNLKKIAGMAGIGVRLSLYVARHSWATAAQSRGIPLSVISQGMGHDSELTTRIYLASLDASVIDNANTRIISALTEKQPGAARHAK